MRALIIRSGALGDTLMLMPSIAFLKGRADIILAGRTPGIDYLRPYVKECFDIERGGWHEIFMNEGRCPGSISRLLPDLNAVAAFMNDTQKTVLPNLKKIFPSCDVNLFSPFPAKGESIHNSLYISHCLERSGLPLNAKAAFFESFKGPGLLSRPVFEKKGYVLFHPGSGSEDKNFSIPFWVEMIQLVCQKKGGKYQHAVVLLGPAEEKVLSFFEGLKAENPIDTVFCPERKEVLSLLEQASLYMGHDSGITHLAAMTGTPVIAFYKKKVKEWAPLGPNVTIIHEEDEKSERIVREVAGVIKKQESIF